MNLLDRILRLEQHYAPSPECSCGGNPLQVRTRQIAISGPRDDSWPTTAGPDCARHGATSILWMRPGDERL